MQQTQKNALRLNCVPITPQELVNAFNAIGLQEMTEQERSEAFVHHCRGDLLRAAAMDSRLKAYAHVVHHPLSRGWVEVYPDGTRVASHQVVIEEAATHPLVEVDQTVRFDAPTFYDAVLRRCVPVNKA